MSAPGVAVVFSGGGGALGHAQCVESGSSEPAGGPEDWHVRSVDFSHEDIEERQGSRIDNPVYQELVPHEFRGGSDDGLCVVS